MIGEIPFTVLSRQFTDELFSRRSIGIGVSLFVTESEIYSTSIAFD